MIINSSLFLQEFSKIFALLLFAIFLGGFIIFASYRLSLFNPDSEKLSAYECGFERFGVSRIV
jgi:NADH-quinone oxidoreductase subunit A